MAVQYMSAFLATFLIVLVSGKMFIPWLEKHNAYQPLKETMEKSVYSDQDNEPST